MLNHEILAIEFARSRQQELIRERDVDRLLAKLHGLKQKRDHENDQPRVIKPRQR
jgi:hypothetical protein